jgi:hypothetical protein
MRLAIAAIASLLPSLAYAQALSPAAPNVVTHVQTAAELAFSAWMRANPAHTSEPALDGFLRWAQATYPCPAHAVSPRTTRPTR